MASGAKPDVGVVPQDTGPRLVPVSSQFQIGTRRRILNGEKRSTQLLSRGARAIHTKGNAGSPARMLRHYRPPWRRQQPQTHDIPTVHRTDNSSTRIDDYAAARQQ